MEIFQQRLKAERQSSGLTQRHMAERLNIAHPSYIRYENGKAEPSLENLVKIAEIFDVSVDYLLGRADI